uniref:Uncharacterized protein n=1 Tax=Lepeophtheirus salmonis TaxID=72036 RepID=A0A0K2VA40_LEPSM
MAVKFCNASTFPCGNFDVESFFETMEKITHVPPRHFNKGATNKQLKKMNSFLLKINP